MVRWMGGPWAWFLLGAVAGGAVATPCVSKWPGCLPLLRLFKLKKRYRNVLDTMFELLPRMARYRPASGPRARCSEACARRAGGQVVVGGEKEARKGLKSRV